MIYGAEGAGKTTIALMAAQTTINNGGYVAYIDTEHGLSPTFAQAFGLRPDDPDSHFALFQPDSGEAALNLIGALLRMRHPSIPDRSPIDLIVLDSLPGVVSAATMAGEVGDNSVAAEARLIAVFFKIYKDALEASGTSLLMINQVRDKIGGFTGHGPAETLPGGRAPKFYAWIIGRVNSPKAITRSGEIVAKQFSVTVKKNKLAPEGRKAEFVVFLDGNNVPDVWGELATVGKALGVFTKEDGITPAGQGYWYFEGEKLAVGETNVLALLRENQDLAERVAATIRVALKAVGDDFVPAQVDAEELPVMITDEEAGHAASNSPAD